MDSFSLLSIGNGQLEEQKLVSGILQTNECAAVYGLCLSPQNAEMLVSVRTATLRDQKRVEFGDSAINKIIEKFMQSTYISQSNYADTIAALIEVFYEVKEESGDILTDEEVVDAMFDYFEGESGGNIELMYSRDLDALCRNVRYSALGINYFEENEEDAEDE